MRVYDGRQQVLPGLPSPALVSAHRRRIAVAPADVVGTTAPPILPVPTKTVELRRMRDGVLVHRFELDGAPRGMTLSRELLTVLVEDEAGRRTLERYRPSGEHLGTTRVSRRTNPVLDSEGESVVFSMGRRINLLDGVSGAITTLRSVPYPPIDLQINRGRVAWAANGRGHGHVLAIRLPIQ
jgi:hypothetical protein